MDPESGMSNGRMEHTKLSGSYMHDTQGNIYVALT